MRNNSVVIHTTRGLIQFSHLTMQIKFTSEMSEKPQAVLTDEALTIQPRTREKVKAFVDHPQNGIQKLL